MRRRLAPPVAALVALLGCSAETQAPDLILIVVDTLRADHVLDPELDLHTPHLDELRASGVTFPRAYAHTSWTLPSHTTIFSSRPPYESGVTVNRQEVPEHLPLLAPHLAERGYRTVAVHSLISLMPIEEDAGIDRGFEVFREPLDAGHADGGTIHAALDRVLERIAEDDRPFFLFAHFSDPHEPYRAHGTREVPARLLLDGEPVAEIPSLADPETVELSFALPPGRHRLDIEAPARLQIRRAVCTAADGTVLPTRFRQGKAGEPYCEVGHLEDEAIEVTLDLWASDVPSPREARRRYALEVEHVDRWIGELLASLRERELLDEALIVFTSDHGEGLGEHDLIAHGVNVYDELLHVPLVIRPPAGHPATMALEAASARLVRHVDLAPTMLELLGASALPGQRGTSILEDVPRLHEAEAHADWADDQYAVFDGRHKLVHVPDKDEWRLYDLRDDPDETTDVLSEHEADLEPWRARIRAMQAVHERRAPSETPELAPEAEAWMQALGYTGSER